MTNTLSKAVFITILSICSVSNSALASVLVINGSDQFSCPVGNCGDPVSGGVEFKTDNTLIVQSGQNIGQTAGVSVTVTGGNNIGEILFLGTSTILGNVSMTGDILRLITVSGTGTVTADASIRVTEVDLVGVGSQLYMMDGASLTAFVNGSSTNTVTLGLGGNHSVIGDIGSVLGPVNVNLSPIAVGGGGIVSTTGNIVGSVNFLNGSTQELRIADNRMITGPVTTAVNNTGTLIFQGSSSTAGDIGTLPLNLHQVSITSGNFILNNSIYATNTFVGNCAKVLVNTDLLLVSGNLNNSGIIQVGDFNSTYFFSAGNYIGNPGSHLNLMVLNGGANNSTFFTSSATFPQDGLDLIITGNTVPDGTVLSSVVSAPVSLTLPPGTPANTAIYKFTPIFVNPILSIKINTTPITSFFHDDPLLLPTAQFFNTIGPTIQTTAPNLIPVLDALNREPNALALQKALASLVLPVNGNLLAISNGGTTRGFQVISERMDNNRAEFERGLIRYKYRCCQEYCDIPCDYAMRAGQWIEFYGSALEQDDETLSGTGYKGRQWTLIAGYDKTFYPSVNGGAAFAYSQVNTHSDGFFNNDLRADSYQGYLYLSHERCDGYYFDGIVSLAYNDYFQERDIDLLSGINQFPNSCGINSIPFGFVETAQGRFGGWQFNSYVEGGYQFRCRNFVVVPYGVWRTTYLRVNEFSESGAPLAGFKNVQYDDMQEFELGAGIKVAQNYICCKKYKITPFIKCLAMHDFKDTPQRGISEFIGGGPPILTTGFERDANSVLVSLGLTLNRKDNSYLTLEYDCESRADFFLYGAFLKYRVEWC